MIESKSFSSRFWKTVIVIILSIAGLACFLPLVNVFAISLSSNAAASAGVVTFWPVNFTLDSYGYVANRAAFWRSMLVSIERLALGVPINLLLTILSAYPLS